MNIQNPRKSSSRFSAGKNKRIRQRNGLYTGVSSGEYADDTMVIGRVGHKYAWVNNKIILDQIIVLYVPIVYPLFISSRHWHGFST